MSQMKLIDQKKINQLKKIAVSVSVAVSGLLAFIKFVAAIYTGSLAILSSMADSLADIISSFITFIAVRFSSQPASFGHRYGYGKAEALSALVQAAFIAGSGFFVVYEGINRFIKPQKVEDTAAGIVVMLLCLLITIGLIVFQKIVVKKTDSLAVAADRAHYLVDVITNISIIISLLIVKVFNFDWFDTIAALFVSFYLLISAYKLAKQAVSLLMDKELPDDVREKVINIVKSCSFCRGLHDLRSRNLGDIYMFELHLELDGALSLYKAHELTDIVENKLKEAFPCAQVIIHQDPAGLVEDRLDDRLINS